jgi:hypothetical protein
VGRQAAARLLRELGRRNGRAERRRSPSAVVFAGVTGRGFGVCSRRLVTFAPRYQAISPGGTIEISSRRARKYQCVGAWSGVIGVAKVASLSSSVKPGETFPDREIQSAASAAYGPSSAKAAMCQSPCAMSAVTVPARFVTS